MRPLFAMPTLLTVALITGGCASQGSAGSDCRFDAKSVVEARSAHQGRVVLVEGHYLSSDGVVRICDRLTASVPPRCSGLLVPGYRLPTAANAKHSGGVTWTEDTVQVLGEVHGNRLRVAGCA
jgi:hypothetical protein